MVQHTVDLETLVQQSLSEQAAHGSKAGPAAISLGRQALLLLPRYLASMPPLNLLLGHCKIRASANA